MSLIQTTVFCPTEELEADGSQTAVRCLLYGYLTGYWACLTGHRPAVFINMTENDVKTALKEPTKEGVLINVCKRTITLTLKLDLSTVVREQMLSYILFTSSQVRDHKTTMQFGEAKLLLKHEEVKWIQPLMAIKKTLGVKNKYIVFTIGKHKQLPTEGVD